MEWLIAFRSYYRDSFRTFLFMTRTRSFVLSLIFLFSITHVAHAQWQQMNGLNGNGVNGLATIDTNVFAGNKFGVFQWVGDSAWNSDGLSGTGIQSLFSSGSESVCGNRGRPFPVRVTSGKTGLHGLTPFTCFPLRSAVQITLREPTTAFISPLITATIGQSRTIVSIRSTRWRRWDRMLSPAA